MGIHHSSWTADRSSFLKWKLSIVVIAAADGCRPVTCRQLLLPERYSRIRTFFCPAIYRFNRVHQRYFSRFGLPAAAHAYLSTRSVRMIDGENPIDRPNTMQQRVHVRNRSRSNAKIKKRGGTIYVRVTLKSCDLTSWNQQQAIEIRLQFAKIVVL